MSVFAVYSSLYSSSVIVLICSIKKKLYQYTFFTVLRFKAKLLGTLRMNVVFRTNSEKLLLLRYVPRFIIVRIFSSLHWIYDFYLSSSTWGVRYLKKCSILHGDSSQKTKTIKTRKMSENKLSLYIYMCV